MVALLAAPRVADGSCFAAAGHAAVPEGDLHLVEYKGNKYQLPIARAVWKSPQVPFEIFSIILREKMGINITTAVEFSSEGLLRALSGCSSSSLACSEEEQAAGQFQEPPAVWLANEVWTCSVEESRLRNFVSGASFTGYLSSPGLRASPAAYDNAQRAGVMLGFWESLLLPGTKGCCFSDLADVQTAMSQLGYTSQIAPGTEGYTTLQSFGLAGHVQDGWYIASACRSDATKCIPVILGEFKWNMREWIDVAEADSLPFAITSYGWFSGAVTAVPELAKQNHGFLFYWWQPDNTFESLSPRMVLFREEMLGIKQSQATEKVAWNKLLEVDRGDDILNMFSLASFSNQQMNQFVTRQLTEDPQDIACQWLLDNEATWSRWLPDSTNCKRGFFYDSGTQECTGCLPGKFTPNRGMTACMECGAGEFQAQVGRTNCEPCLAGAYSQGGAAVCASCPVGSWQHETGQSQCTSCDSAGQLTTQWPGSTSEGECVCPKDSYRPLEAAGDVLCKSCPVGMSCALGSDLRNVQQGTGPFSADQPFPRLEPGYMSLASEPTHVFRCLPESSCPGGGTASCAPMRDTEKPACGECSSGSYASGGDCKECGGLDSWPFIAAAAIGVAGLALLTFMVNRNLLLQSNATITSVVMLGLLFSELQTMGIFMQMDIEWTGPMLVVLNVLEVMSFDLQILRTGCIPGSTQVNSFIMRQIVAPCSIPIIFFVLCLKRKVWRPRTNIRMELINTVGTVFNIFFISIVISGVTPFVCYKHPSGDWSMVSATSILCFKGGQHSTMLAVGIVSLVLVPLPFLAGACLFIWRYPRYLAGSREAQSRQALQAMRFTYIRYCPHRYFYGILLLSRSLAICLVPVIFRDEVALQICAMGFLILATALLQQQLNPWRSRTANWMDGVLSMMLMLLLLSGAMMTNLGARPEIVEIVGLLAVLFVFLVTGGAILLGLYSRWKPRPWYSYFICHHKADAAAQARLLKMKLQAKTHRSIFIDSDNLTALDDLFDIVKCKVDHLVVYLTRDTLSRPWCAGEIVTAFKTGRVKVTAVKTPSFHTPREERLACIDKYLDLTSCTLEEYGISFDHVRDAYKRLLSASSPQLRVEKEGGVRNLDVLVEHLRTTRGAGSVPEFKGDCARASVSVHLISPRLPVLPTDLEGTVIVSSDQTDEEAAAAAAILSTRIQEQVLSVTKRGILLFEDFQAEDPATYGMAAKQSRAVVVLLSRGSMMSAAQLQVIISAMAAQGPQGGDPRDSKDVELQASHESSFRMGKRPVIVPVIVDGFRFPDDSYYNKQLPRILPELADEARPLIHAFFKTIALPLTTSAPDHVLETQLDLVFERIPK